jgi:hypothetical protein
VKGQREMSGRVGHSSHRAVSVISDLYTGLLKLCMSECWLANAGLPGGQFTSPEDLEQG